MTVHWLVTSDPDWLGIVNQSKSGFIGRIMVWQEFEQSMQWLDEEGCKRWVEKECPHHLTRRWVTVEEK